MVTSQKKDYLIKKIKIKLTLLLKGTVVSKTTIKRHLTDKFGLKAYKCNKKSRLILSIKAKNMLLPRLTWVGSLKTRGKLYFLMSQLCCSLHLTSKW